LYIQFRNPLVKGIGGHNKFIWIRRMISLLRSI
jgi:hypothetical protein